MWRDKYNLNPDDDTRRKVNRVEPHGDTPPPEAGEEARFHEDPEWAQRNYEVSMYFVVRLKDETKIQVRLPMVVPDYCMSPFTEVLNQNNIPYGVLPLEGIEEEEDEEGE